MVSDLVVIGPLAVRRFVLEKVCESHSRHCHPYDHVTLVIRGCVKVSYKYTENGQVVEGESREFRAEEMIHIKAGVEHEVKGLEPDTKYVCIFPHRDLDGMVVQDYIGNDKAYT